MNHIMRVDARTADEITFVCDECDRVTIVRPGELTESPYLVLVRGDESVTHSGSTLDWLTLSVRVDR